MAEREVQLDTPKESLSQFFARVLDQLTITAWLPSLMLVGSCLLLSQLSTNDGSLPKAFKSIGEIGLAGVVFLIVAVVISTMFVQAFEFEAIRFFEGYWPASGPVGALTRRKRAKKIKEFESLARTRDDRVVSALASARSALQQAGGLGNGGLDALESFVRHTTHRDSTTEEDKASARSIALDWKRHADPHLVNQLDETEQKILEFPQLAFRILPTRLGNIIRGAEDQFHSPEQHGRLETSVIHLLDSLPRSISVTYREQRRRLDLYCALLFVFAALIPLAISIGVPFPESQRPTAVLVPAGLAALAFLSYRAALASGRKFGLALTAIAEHQARSAGTHNDGG